MQIECPINHGEDFKGYLDIFDADPEGLMDDISMLQREVGGTFVMIGYVNGLEQIFVSNEGAVILREITLSYWASNFDDFLERILTGKMRASPPANYLPGQWPVS